MRLLLVYPVLWVCPPRCLYQLEVRAEGRDVWRLYLGLAKEKGAKHFGAALDYASVRMCTVCGAPSPSLAPLTPSV